MIKCFIVDDEPHAIDVLKHYILQVPFLKLEGSATNPLEGLQGVVAKEVDLLFLDIQMPELTGLDFIAAMQKETKVILTTAYSEYALQGYELDIVDYLLKPIRFPRFLTAVQKVARLLHDQRTGSGQLQRDGNGYLFVKTETKGKLTKIDVVDIEYIEAANNYIAVHTGGKKVLVNTTMKEIEERLSPSQFIRVHKSFIVPIAKIAGVEGNRVLLKTIKAVILNGERYKTDLLTINRNKLLL